MSSYTTMPVQETIASRQIFINDIAGDTSTADLRSMFSEVGTVTNVEIDTNELNRHFAFVTFESSKGVEAAIAKFNTNMNNTSLVCRRRTELEAMRQKRMIDARCKLFVGNIPQNLSPTELRQEMERLCQRPIADFRHKKGYCFVGFTSPQDAEDARRNLKSSLCGGKALNAEFKKEDPIRNEPGFIAVLEQAQRTLYVRDIPLSTNPESFKQIFETHGKVRKFTLPIDSRTSQLIGYAFIEYFWKEGCDNSLKQTEGLLIEGVAVEIRVSDPPKDKGPGRGGGGGGGGGGRADRRQHHGHTSFGNGNSSNRDARGSREFGHNRDRRDARPSRQSDDRGGRRSASGGGGRFSRHRSRSRSRSRSRDRGSSARYPQHAHPHSIAPPPPHLHHPHAYAPSSAYPQTAPAPPQYGQPPQYPQPYYGQPAAAPGYNPYAPPPQNAPSPPNAAANTNGAGTTAGGGGATAAAAAAYPPNPYAYHYGGYSYPYPPQQAPPAAAVTTDGSAAHTAAAPNGAPTQPHSQQAYGYPPAPAHNGNMQPPKVETAAAGTHSNAQPASQTSPASASAAAAGAAAAGVPPQQQQQQQQQAAAANAYNYYAQYQQQQPTAYANYYHQQQQVGSKTQPIQSQQQAYAYPPQNYPYATSRGY